MEKLIQALAEVTPIFGTCGGFQMLGRRLHDPHHIESDLDFIDGMGLLDIDFAFTKKKTVARRTYYPTSFNPFGAVGPVSGYEIHCGHATQPCDRPLFTCQEQDANGGSDGAAHPNKPIFGSFVHDLFRDPSFCQAFLNFLRARKGLPVRDTPLEAPSHMADQSLDRIAEMIRANWSPELTPVT